MIGNQVQLDPGLRMLVNLRASIVNGCAYYQPGTHHQPYTETGVRMFIVGPATPAEPGEATGTA